jgi:3-keto-disaccharide hydrolase
MIRPELLMLAGLLVAVACGEGQTLGALPLFDGSSLNGWEGDSTLWRVIDGAIVGGTLKMPVAQSEYLCTQAEFADFELRLSARLTGGPNAGVHFRSHRVPGSNEVAGYQADIGFAPGRIIAELSDTVPDSLEQPYPLWGSLADEFRPEPDRYPDPAQPVRFLVVAPSELVKRVLRPADWNEITVAAVEPRIRLQLNGVTTVDFTEKGNVPPAGKVCLQIHDGPPVEAWYKNISIRQISMSRR